MCRCNSWNWCILPGYAWCMCILLELSYLAGYPPNLDCGSMIKKECCTGR
ncbi:hypothetical protein ACP275_01G120500 [Erythranthe tilingii]